MNKLLKSTLVFLALLTPAVASADDSGVSLFQSPGQETSMNPYVGGGMGAYVITPGSGMDTVFGGYGSIGAEVLPYLAIEVRVGSTANGSNVNGTFGTDYFFSYLAKPHITLQDQTLNLYGLIGGSTIRTWWLPNSGAKLSKTKSSFSVGAGAEFHPTKKMMLGVEGLFMDMHRNTGFTTTTFKGSFMASFVGTVRFLF